MLKRIAFMMLCMSLLGLVATTVAVAYKLSPILRFFLG